MKIIMITRRQVNSEVIPELKHGFAKRLEELEGARQVPPASFHQDRTFSVGTSEAGSHRKGRLDNRTHRNDSGGGSC